MDPRVVFPRIGSMRRLLLPLLLLLALLCGIGWYHLNGGEKLRFVLRCRDCDATVAEFDRDVLAARLERCGARSIDLDAQGDRIVASFRPPREPHDWANILALKGRFRIAELVRGRDLPEAVALLRERLGDSADLHPGIQGTDTLFASAMLVPERLVRRAERIVSEEGFAQRLRGRAVPMWGASPGIFNENDARLEGGDLHFVSTTTRPEHLVGNGQIEKAVFEPAHDTYVDLIRLQLTPEGSTALDLLIRANIDRFLANVLDDRVLSAAMVVGPIPTRTYTLVGCGTLCSALADILTTPPLSGTWQIEEQPRR